MNGPARGAHPVARQWAWLALALLTAVVVASATDAFRRADLAVYDVALPTLSPPTEIAIVAIDDASIDALGRWPWRRALHAALLEKLRAYGVRAVALDVLLTEPDATSPAGDAALAAAMRSGPPVVLPLLVDLPLTGAPRDDTPPERAPVTTFAAAAAGVGHAHLELDADGVARSVFLTEGGDGSRWPHLALALLRAAHDPAAAEPAGQPAPRADAAPGEWLRDRRYRFPFVGPPGTFPQVSYVEVLRGDAPAEALRDRLVLVGATAQGVGDAYPTPESGHGRAMPGVEIAANVVHALRSRAEIRVVPRPLAMLLGCVPVALGLLGVLLLAPRRAWLLVVLLATATLGAAAAALHYAHWWWPPAAPFVALVALYPLWAWRRLDAAHRSLADAVEQLAAEPLPLLAAAADDPTPALAAVHAAAAGHAPGAAAVGLADPVQRGLDRLRVATERIQDARRVLEDVIGGLPNATLLADAQGRIVLANAVAAEFAGEQRPEALVGRDVDAVVHAALREDPLRFAALAAAAPCTAEARRADPARDYLVRAVPFYDAAGRRIGTIVDCADVTPLRQAQRERDDVLRFLSHELKSPAASLLGLAELQRDPRRALPPAQLSERLDVLANRTLALLDGFIALARAESVDPAAFESFDLRDAIQDASDEVWASAEVRRIALEVATPRRDARIHGDRHLLARALVNLLGNAVKYSPDGATVRLAFDCDAERARVIVEDQGPGIAPERHAELFRKFSRGVHRGDVDPGGAGLGLAFVRVVAEKHGGHVAVGTAAGGGSAFTLSLPLAHDTPTPA